MTYVPELSSSFIIKNVVNKAIRVFGVFTLKPNQQVDLFDVIPNLTEDRLLADLANGDLDLEINNKGSLTVVSHNLISLRAIMKQGRPEYAGPAGAIYTIYVAENGSDLTGDGSASNPYRQPQRAIDEIPDDSVSIFIIQCGAGSFISPVGERITSTLFIVGDRSNPKYSFETNPSFSFVSGKVAQKIAEVEHGLDITDQSHWMERSSGSLVLGESLLESDSSTLNCLAGHLDTLPNCVAIHSYNTIFTHPRNFFGTTSKKHSYVGINFAPSASFPSFTSMLFRACKINTAVTAQIKNCAGTIAAIGSFVNMSNGAADQTGLSFGGIFTHRISLNGGHIYLAKIVIRATSGSAQIWSDSVFGNRINFFGNIDFEGTVRCVSIGAGTTLRQNYNITISNSPPSYLLSSGASLYQRTAGTITGSTTGIPIVLNDGSQAIGIKAACNGTLTNSTNADQDITVGGNAVVAFAALPTTDVAAGSPQFCRAT